MDFNRRSETEIKLFEHRRSAPPRVSNLNEIQPPPRPTFRKYHMESDIFGLGSTTSSVGAVRERQLVVDPAQKGLEMGAAGKKTVIQHIDWFGGTPEQTNSKPDDEVDGNDGNDEELNSNENEENVVVVVEEDLAEEQETVRNNGNARENGGNPVTGAGYKQDFYAGQSKRRQFVKPASSKLW